VKSASPGRRVLTECPVVLIMLYCSKTRFIGQLLFEQDQGHQHSLHNKTNTNGHNV
jgi:hypothetical protein